jgi:hypothetical protein
MLILLINPSEYITKGSPFRMSPPPWPARGGYARAQTIQETYFNHKFNIQ